MIYNFDNAHGNNLFYGCTDGKKLGIIINNENYILKFSKRISKLTYNTSPLSEYIGSHIYESVNIPVHKTVLGIKDKKIVVACKDFRKNSDIRFVDYNSINNIYVSGLEEKIESSSTSDHAIDLNEVMIVMENNPVFKRNSLLKKRFWDMFVIDSLIANNNQNNGNWGILVNDRTNEEYIAPVFDNGSSFGCNIDDKKINYLMNDSEKFKQSAYLSRICIFSMNGKNINPIKYIQSMKNKALNKFLIDLIPKINIFKVSKIINDIPNNYNNIEVISDDKKKYYIESFKYRFNILLDTYNKLKGE